MQRLEALSLRTVQNFPLIGYIEGTAKLRTWEACQRVNESVIDSLANIVDQVLHLLASLYHSNLYNGPYQCCRIGSYGQPTQCHDSLSK